MMKKWGFVLVLAVALVCGSCGNEDAAMSTRDESGLPLAEWTDQPVIAQTLVNSGMSMEQLEYNISEQLAEDRFRFMEQRSEDGLICVGAFGAKGHKLAPWIVPQHEGYVIMESSEEAYGYTADDQYFYWLELPVQASEKNNRWYLYVRERPAEYLEKELAEPICVAEGTLDVGTEAKTITAFFCDWEARNGRVLWAQPATGTKETVIRLYRAETNETQELGRFMADANADCYGAQVALTDNRAIWNEFLAQEDGGLETQLNCYDLTNGTVAEIAAKEVFEDPLVVGDYLLARTLPTDEKKGRQAGTVPNEIWVYDLVQGKWLYRVSTELPVFEETMHFEHPLVIDDKHIALAASGAQDVYQLPALDLTTGKIYKLESIPEAPLYYCRQDCSEETLSAQEEQWLDRILPLKEGHTTNVAMKWVYSTYYERFERQMYAINFLW